MRLLSILLLIVLLETYCENSIDEHEHPKEKHFHKKKIIHEKLVLCHKPDFFDEAQCDIPVGTPTTPIADLIQLDITKMPFKMDNWIHMDIIPTPEALSSGTAIMIRHAYIQISDSKNRVLGRIAEQIPCEAIGHPNYMEGEGEISELFKNPGVLTGSTVMECMAYDHLSYNMNPNVPIMKFNSPVRAFYANFKFTREEAQMIQDDSSTERVSITTILVDEEGNCYLHHLDKLDGLPAAKNTKQEMKVPVSCHSVGPAFKDAQGKKSPLRMNPQLKINMSALTFLTSPGGRPNSRLVSHGSPTYMRKVKEYNNKMYNVDSQGYLPGGKALELKGMKRIDSELRSPGVPLIMLPRQVELTNTDNETNQTATGQGESLRGLVPKIFSCFFPLALVLVLNY